MEMKLTRTTLGFADYTANAATTGVANVVVLPANAVVADAFAKAGANFTGGAISAVTAQLGYSGTTNALLAATSVFTGTPVIGDADAEKGGDLDGAASAIYTASKTIQLLLTSTGANLTA